MVATCPHCQTRYRVAAGRIGARGARLRCRRCDGTFRVMPETGAAAGPPRVVIALREMELAKAAAEHLTACGVEVQLCADGVEGLLALQRKPPTAAFFDLRVERISGLEVLELCKRNPSLRSIPLVMVVDGVPVEPPGGVAALAPDAELDVVDLPEGVSRSLRELGIAVTEPPRASDPFAAPGPTPAPVAAPAVAPAAPPPSTGPPPAPAPTFAPPAPRPVPQAAPAAPVSEAPAGDPELADVRAQAERLARIVISDIVLYNEAKFDTAAKTGNIEEAMAGDLREGRALFDSRVDPRVAGERDFLVEELRRVAARRRG